MSPVVKAAGGDPYLALVLTILKGLRTPRERATWMTARMPMTWALMGPDVGEWL